MSPLLGRHPLSDKTGKPKTSKVVQNSKVLLTLISSLLEDIALELRPIRLSTYSTVFIRTMSTPADFRKARAHS
jgi:hypothetical protein